MNQKNSTLDNSNNLKINRNLKPEIPESNSQSVLTGLNYLDILYSKYIRFIQAYQVKWMQAIADTEAMQSTWADTRVAALIREVQITMMKEFIKDMENVEAYIVVDQDI